MTLPETIDENDLYLRPSGSLIVFSKRFYGRILTEFVGEIVKGALDARIGNAVFPGDFGDCVCSGLV